MLYIPHNSLDRSRSPPELHKLLFWRWTSFQTNASCTAAQPPPPPRTHYPNFVVMTANESMASSQSDDVTMFSELCQAVA